MTPVKAGEMVEKESWRFGCPVCGFEYTRFVGHREDDGQDNYATGTGVRGNVFSLVFEAECGSRFEVKYGFHKGQTYMWNEVVTSCRIEYQDYILSPEWKVKATAAKDAAGWRCQICNRPSTAVTLDAHHRTYERLGHERPDDITVLCRDCHELYESNRKARQNGKVQL